MSKLIGVCYLCGEILDGNADRDHVPPKHIFSREVRRRHNPDLLTLPTHKACNLSYKLDEEYFIHTLAPLAMDTYSGRSMLRELFAQYQSKRNVPLSRTVLREFEERPSGLYLTDGKVIKRFDGKRVWRVVWKIVRGLFFHEYRTFLPEDTPRNFKVISPGHKPPPEFSLLLDEPIRGTHPGVFDYKYGQFPEYENAHLWAMLFWDKLIMQVFFHDPKCNCERCVELTEPGAK